MAHCEQILFAGVVPMVVRNHWNTASVLLFSMTASVVLAALPPQVSRPPARDTPAQATVAPGASSIRGRVLNTEGRPLRRVQVRVIGAKDDSKSRASTDADGNYELVGLSAGRYSLSFSRSGYLPLRYGQRYPGEAGQQVELGDQQVVSNINMILPRAAVIAGRITDELGDPLPGAQATALQVRYFQGRRRLVLSGAPARTDDTGAYRILGLLPGEYFVIGSSRELWSVGQGEKQQMFGYAPTYFPGTSGLATAQRVRMALGQEVGSVDFSLVVGKVANISGVALTSGGEMMAGANISLFYELSGPGGGMISTVSTASAGPDGTWRLQRVPPGEYLLRSEGTVGGAKEEAVQRIAVEGDDIDGVLLVAGRGGTISGSVTRSADATGKIDLSRLRVQARSLELRLTVPSPESGTVATDGQFTTDGVVGAQRLSVAGLPEGWVVKRIERHGEELTDRDLILRSAENVDAVRIELTDRVTTISGTVTDKYKKPTASGTIVVFSQNSELWGDFSRHVATVRPTQTGEFKIIGLPLGKYFAIAIEFMQEDDWRDPEVLRSLERYATGIELNDFSTKLVSLSIER
jgi:hypothetical protein